MSTTPLRDSSDHTAKAYTRQRIVLAELQSLAQFAAIVAYGVFGLQQRPIEIATASSHNFYLQAAICWLPLYSFCAVSILPFSLYGFYLQRRFGLAKASLSGWLWDFLKANALGFVFGGVLLEIAFATNLFSSTWGWIPAGVLCSLLLLGLTTALPRLLSLFYPVVPVGDRSLRDRLIALGSKAGIRVEEVYEWRVSARTRQANAFVSGIAQKRHVTLTDTILQELSPDEVEAIVAHELGHCALHHIAKRLLIRVPIYCAIFLLMTLAVWSGLIRFADEGQGWADLRLIPGLFFLWQLGNPFGNLIMAAVSRRQEKQADLFGWKLMSGSRPFISAMQKLMARNMIVFDKSTQWRFLHPPTADRIIAAEQFEKEIQTKVDRPQETADQFVAR